MRIHSFLPEEGRYHFELETLSAAFHAHPAIEILLAKKEGRSRKVEVGK